MDMQLILKQRMKSYMTLITSRQISRRDKTLSVVKNIYYVGKLRKTLNIKNNNLV